MIENVLYLFSEVSLLLGVLALMLYKFFTTSVRSYFKITKIVVIISALFSVLFYNKAVFTDVFEANSYTVLFYILSALVMFAWLSLSVKWFVSEDVDPLYFCILSLLAMFSFSLIIKTINLGVLCGGLILLSFINYSLLKFSQQSEELHNVSKRYLVMALIFSVLLILSLVCLSIENWHYKATAEFLGSENINIAMFIVGAILFFMLFLLGIAPLHFCFADIVSPSILPVAAYFNLVPVFALFAAFMKLNTIVFIPLASELNLVYLFFGVFSLIVGAIGANASRNLRKIFAYSGIYNLGMLLLLISPFTASKLLGGFIYLQVYILSLFGVYTSFYSFKSNGVYLANLNMINGIAKVRPFVSAAMLFFMISLMGISPFSGFIGQLSALETFVENQAYIIMFISLVCLIIVMAAYLQIIRSMYFNNREVDFNRPDYGVYVYLLINMILMVMLMFKPEFLLYDAPVILNLVLK